ncbi:MAG: DUF4157 domain-containing protein [Deltaproteobacteria bacterium]|nr:DUF4157 domain-containing protein [Kofleriaceae bacterium]
MTQRRGYRTSDDDLDVAHRHQPAPGKTARTDGLPVQRKDGGGGASDADVQARAAEGVSGAGGSLPFMDVIQRSFGAHDLSSTRAHTDANAQAASESIGARAYAVGNDVAFAGTPDLHTAAHEAAHVVQQRAGVHLKGGVGQAGDRYEQHADAVADLVVQGKSAEGLLDTMSGQSGASDMAVQKDEAEDTRPKKKVGKASKARLDAASKAIAYTKKVMAKGAGNQWEAIKATNANSTFRMQVMRDENNEYWEVEPELWDVISANPAAFTAAKAELMDGGGGGNCGEHADLAFDYLCATTSGDEVAVSQQKDFDHAFVIIGAMSEEDEQLVVSDPWPTRPVAVMWTDHFAYCDRKALLRHQVGNASGKSPKDVIKKGLRLTPLGRSTMQAKLSDKETDKLLKDGRQGDHPWIWNHPTTPAQGHDYNYVE